MSDPKDLQFDKAEFKQGAPGGSSCVLCKQTIVSTYFEVNGNLLCPGCRDRFLATLTGGAPASRILKATVFGFAAAAAGTGLYYAIVKLTGYNIGLVAIVVGLMVGAAVRNGAEGRGGIGYQLLGVALTYLSIAATYIPMVLEAASEQQTVSYFAASLFAFMLPVASATAQPLTLLIIGFGLWEAWKMNEKRKVVVTGPYQVGAPAPRVPNG